MTIQQQRHLVDVLPFEVLSNIFALLSRIQVHECMLVCRQWHTSVPELASHCFRHLRLDGRKDYQGYVGLLPRVCNYANVVTLHDYGMVDLNASKVGDLLIHHCPNLEILEIEDSHIHEHLGPFLEKLPSIRHLKIIRPASIPSPLHEIIHSIASYCPQLVSLSATRAKPSVVNGIHPPVKESTLIGLRHLDLQRSGLSVLQLETVLKRCPNLRTLIVDSQDDMGKGKETLARHCPKIQHFSLCYQPPHTLYLPIPLPSDDDDIAEDEGNYQGDCIALKGLWIHGFHARFFLDQTHLHYLRLEQYRKWGTLDVTTCTTITQLVQQNVNTLEHIDLGSDVDMLHTLCESLPSMSNLKSFRFSFDGRTRAFVDNSSPVDLLEKIGKVASSHPTLTSIHITVIAIGLKSSVLSAMSRIPLLKQLHMCYRVIAPADLEALFHNASSLEHVTLTARHLEITNKMFVELAKLNLDHASFFSDRTTTMSALGLRHFVDQHAGALYRMSIMGNIQPDDDGKCLDYAREKLGERFNYGNPCPFFEYT